MLTLRKSSERGHVDHGWLKAKHSFSFGSYYDPRFTGHRDLLVLNEDIVAPAQGFGLHPHKDMEIVTYVIEGAIKHEDTLGNSSIIYPGEVQRMSAGSGIRHSEYNYYDDKKLKLLQIWIQTERPGIDPSYEQRSFKEEIKSEDLTLVVDKYGEKNALKIHQNVKFWVSKSSQDKNIKHHLTLKNAWIQLISGNLDVNGLEMNTGDGLAITAQEVLNIKTQGKTEFLLIELQ